MESFRITRNRDGQVLTVPVEPGLTLAQHLYVAGAFAGRPLCSGTGRCGLCQVRFSAGAPEPLREERGRITPARLEEGWRLSCNRPPVPGSEVLADLEEGGEDPPLPGPGAGGFLGIDLGTTSVQWRFSLDGEETAGSFPNPQLGAGSEVMSRLALARVPSGAARLKEAVVRAARRIVAGLPCLPAGICLAGNTCMTYLALGMDVSGLARAPYRLDWPGQEVVRLDDSLPGVYIPPLVAPFVGGDVSAGLLALAWRAVPPRPPYLLADLGTNGEFALVMPGGETLVASVPMGPALEGVGMSQGMLAGPGAAVAFEVAPGGLAPVFFRAGSAPRGPAGHHCPAASGAGAERALRGVSGTGYLSLVARLKGLGVVEESGRFARRAPSPLAAKLLAGLRNEGEWRLSAGGAELFASDVEALLKVKAAFSAAVKLLLAEAGLEFAGLTEVCLAGALGEHVKTADLEALGFFPPGGAGRAKAVGNTSLEGACLAAQDGKARSWLAELPGRTRLVEVVAAPDFQRIYLEAMRFAYVR